MNNTSNNIIINIIFLIFLSLLSFCSSSSSSVNFDLNWWCNHSPHPRACLIYLSPHYAHHPPKYRTDFYKLSVRVAHNLTLHAQSHLEALGSKARNHRTRKAIRDCSKLYGNTLIHLDHTLNAFPRNCTPFDAQTWLSAALTNLRTCRKGFSDLKVSYRVVEPITRYNVSELISNCLAINRRENMTVVAPTASNKAWNAALVGRRNLLQISTRAKADFVVSKAVNSRFKTVQSAVNAAAAMRQSGVTKKIVIYVQSGVYNEIVNIANSLTDLTMVGDGSRRTIITGSRSVARGFTTFSSPTFSVFGDRFIASYMTFRNTNGPGSQAVALLSGSDQSVFYRCSIEGYQDTLCVYTQRQFYRECNIYGTIDFIFGNAAVVIQNSNIFLRRPRRGEANVITAQGRTDPNQNTGIVIQSSRIQAAPDLLPAQRAIKSYLGRPWMLYSRTVYLQNTIDSIIDPSGWLPFNGVFALNTLYYAEFKNRGGGSMMRFRVKWRGYHIIVQPSIVRKFTVANFIAGGAWLPASRVPFSLGL